MLFDILVRAYQCGQLCNELLEYLFDPGKKYMIKYKLKRFSPDSTKWKVIFVIKEEKPKQTK